MPNWKKIKAEYIRGGVSYRKLADKYSVSFGTLRKVASKEKWTDLRSKKVAKADTKMIEAMASREAEKEDKIQTIADMLLDKIIEKINDGSYTIESKDMRSVTAALKDIREIKGYKSDLDVQEQMARIEKLKRDANTDANIDVGQYGVLIMPPIAEEEGESQ